MFHGHRGATDALPIRGRIISIHQRTFIWWGRAVALHDSLLLGRLLWNLRWLRLARTLTLELHAWAKVRRSCERYTRFPTHLGETDASNLVNDPVLVILREGIVILFV